MFSFKRNKCLPERKAERMPLLLVDEAVCRKYVRPKVPLVNFFAVSGLTPEFNEVIKLREHRHFDWMNILVKELGNSLVTAVKEDDVCAMLMIRYYREKDCGPVGKYHLAFALPINGDRITIATADSDGPRATKMCTEIAQLLQLRIEEGEAFREHSTLLRNVLTEAQDTYDKRINNPFSPNEGTPLLTTPARQDA